jgi:hypothetical protein
MLSWLTDGTSQLVIVRASLINCGDDCIFRRLPWDLTGTIMVKDQWVCSFMHAQTSKNYKIATTEREEVASLLSVSSVGGQTEDCSLMCVLILLTRTVLRSSMSAHSFVTVYGKHVLNSTN